MNRLAVAAHRKDAEKASACGLQRLAKNTLHVQALLPCLVVAAGVCLRLLYCASHEYLDLSHDAHAHIEYIKYVRQHWQLPPVDGGWEFYQPPAYYWFAAAVMNAAEGCGLSEIQSLSLLKWISFVCTSLVLLISAGIAGLVYPLPHMALQRAALISSVAAVPGMVFLASQINNDVPAQLFMFGSIYLLLKWWQRKTGACWFACAGLIGLGLLTKSNCLILLLAAILTLVFARGLSTRKKLSLATALFATVISIAGWFTIPRAMEKSSLRDYLVSNHNRIPSELIVKNNVATLLTFNPVEVVQTVYNDSWSDRARRDYLLEYAFKSAFFGEYQFGDHLRPLARTILLSAMLLGFAAVVNLFCVLCVSPLWNLPVWLSAALFGAALIANRAIYPYSVCGDFRFVTAVLPGLGALIAWQQHNALAAQRVEDQSVKHTMRLIVYVSLTIFVVSCSIFILAICCRQP